MVKRKSLFKEIDNNDPNVRMLRGQTTEVNEPRFRFKEQWIPDFKKAYIEATKPLSGCVKYDFSYNSIYFRAGAIADDIYNKYKDLKTNGQYHLFAYHGQVCRKDPEKDPMYYMILDTILVTLIENYITGFGFVEQNYDPKWLMSTYFKAVTGDDYYE